MVYKDVDFLYICSMLKRVGWALSILVTTTFSIGCSFDGKTQHKSVKAINPNDKNSFVAFESAHVRPIVLSSDRSKLYAVNTPDNRLEVFDITKDGLLWNHSIPVGMEPVSIALRSDDEAWVVNHLSDSVSIVNLSTDAPSVIKTLLVGDEPRDIVFAGKAKNKAFITTAHRGQNVPFNPHLTTPGVGRADIWVFNADNLGSTPGGRPEKIINLFSDTPRALAVDPQGRYVYAAAFHSGNQTTTLKVEIHKGGLAKPPPHTDIVGAPAPKTGLIVKFNGKDWVDNGDPISGQKPGIWTNRVRFNLPDKDVFVIDSYADSPEVVKTYTGVGTTLFNMALNPVNGNVYVSNTEARNHVRFAASGKRSSTLRGHFVENRITILSKQEVVPQHLNKHIVSYDKPLGNKVENSHSLAIPLSMVVTKNGKKIYVAAFGSSKVGVFNTEELENGTFAPDQDIFDFKAKIKYYSDKWDSVCLHYHAEGEAWTTPPGIRMKPVDKNWFTISLDIEADKTVEFVPNNCKGEWDNNNKNNYRVEAGSWSIDNGLIRGEKKRQDIVPNNHIKVSGGPSGLAIDENNNKLYVFSRFNNVISTIDTLTNAVIEETHLFNPEPEELIAGRPFLYDASLTSSRGDSSCASCHVFGDTDHLAWDLGDPDAIATRNPNKYLPVGPPGSQFPFFHPMKGPMTTQSLKGLTGHGPMHWRGDKTGASGEKLASLEEKAFEEFNVAFVDVHGRANQLDQGKMKKFRKFAMMLKYPPNPIANFDRSLTQEQLMGVELFKNGGDEIGIDCKTCHTLDVKNKKYGTLGLMNVSVPESGRDEDFKIPHLRNLFQKVGMFGSTGSPEDGLGHMGDQVRGFGFNHDGSIDTIRQVLTEDIFQFDSKIQKNSLEAFVFTIGGEMAPIVGQQISLDKESFDNKEVNQRVDLLIERAKVIEPIEECDLIVKGVIDGELRGAYFLAEENKFQLDNITERAIPESQLRAFAKREGNVLTYTCVPPGSGVRMGIDRDGDGLYDHQDKDVIPQRQ